MPDFFRRLAQDLERSREALVPTAFQILWQITRFIVLYGGRASAKSWSIARVLLMQGYEQPLRILICREILGSLRQSAYQLLVDQIELLGLTDFYTIQAETITGKNGTKFYFQGLKYNAEQLRSYEGVDIVWVEEAQSVSEFSWETLLPTIRKAGSRFLISFNPMTPDDPVAKRFVDNPPPNCIVRKVSWRDNPHLSPEADAERVWLEKTDQDAYRHVWEGLPRTVSDALILRNKFVEEAFEVQSTWAGPYHGLDYGFSRDPSAAVRCYVDDETRTLYVDREFWALAMDIDAMPEALELAIPGVSRHVVYADSARPESTSYLSRNGIPNARSAEKWPGSVDDGIAYLRSFARIVVAPECRKLLDECRSYSFKTDRLTGVPLPEPLDKNNHLIDALRYALSPLIRNKPAGGFFTRAALLENGEPLEVASKAGLPRRIICTIATSGSDGGAVGVIHWAHFEHYGYPLVALDYDLVEIDTALSARWLSATLERAQALRDEWGAMEPTATAWVEQGELYEALSAVFAGEVLDLSILEAGRRPGADIGPVEAETLPRTLEERANKIRAVVNGGRFVKVAHSAYARQVTHRSVAANHLLNQVLGYRPSAKDGPVELVAAFTLGALLVLDEDQRPVRLPEPQRPPQATVTSERVEAKAAQRTAFERELAEWEARRVAKIAEIRLRLGNPHWNPRSWQQLGIGAPPVNPAAMVRLA